MTELNVCAEVSPDVENSSGGPVAHNAQGGDGMVAMVLRRSTITTGLNYHFCSRIRLK